MPCLVHILLKENEEGVDLGAGLGGMEGGVTVVRM